MKARATGGDDKMGLAWVAATTESDDEWWWWHMTTNSSISHSVGVMMMMMASRWRLGSLSHVASISGLSGSLSLCLTSQSLCLASLSLCFLSSSSFFFRLSLSPLGLLLSYLFMYLFTWVMGSCLLGWPAGLGIQDFWEGGPSLYIYFFGKI